MLEDSHNFRSEISKMGLDGIVPAGVVTGDNLMKLFEYCKKHGHALPGKILTNLGLSYCGLT